MPMADAITEAALRARSGDAAAARASSVRPRQMCGGCAHTCPRARPPMT